MIAKPVVAILLAAALIGSVAGVRLVRLSGGAGIGSEQEKRIKGSRTAKLSVIEYFDYQCGACRTAYELFEEYERAFPGSIRIVMRYFPLPGHASGLKAAIHAECASAQGKFWPFHERMMKYQQEWSNRPNTAAAFRGYASEAGVNLTTFDACVVDPETEITVLREKEGGIKLGIKLTPTCLINGNLVVGANAAASELKKTFGELKKSDEKISNTPTH